MCVGVDSGRKFSDMPTDLRRVADIRTLKVAMRKPCTKAFTLHVYGTADTRLANRFEDTCDIWTDMNGATLPNGTDRCS